MIVLDAFAAVLKSMCDAPFIVQLPIGLMLGVLFGLLIFPDPFRLR